MNVFKLVIMSGMKLLFIRLLLGGVVIAEIRKRGRRKDAVLFIGRKTLGLV
jgi:hypothetical protein